MNIIKLHFLWVKIVDPFEINNKHEVLTCIYPHYNMPLYLNTQ